MSMRRKAVLFSSTAALVLYGAAGRAAGQQAAEKTLCSYSCLTRSIRRRTTNDFSTSTSTFALPDHR
jgi:hypothetical protein